MLCNSLIWWRKCDYSLGKGTMGHLNYQNMSIDSFLRDTFRPCKKKIKLKTWNRRWKREPRDGILSCHVIRVHSGRGIPAVIVTNCDTRWAMLLRCRLFFLIFCRGKKFPNFGNDLLNAIKWVNPMYWSLHTNTTAYISTNRGYWYVKGDEGRGV